MDVFAELDDGSDRAPAAPRVRAVPQRRVAVLCGRGEHEPWVHAVFSHLALGERKGHGPEREEEGRVNEWSNRESDLRDSSTFSQIPLHAVIDKPPKNNIMLSLIPYQLCMVSHPRNNH